MICIRCGAEFDDNTVFCPECGAAVIADNDKTVAVPFDEMTQRAKHDVSSDSDATTVADYDESTAVDDSTLLGDDKAFVSPEIKKSKRSSGEGKDKKSTVIAVVAIVAVLLVALAAVLLFFKSKSGEDAATTAATTAPVTEQEIPEDVVVIEVPALDGKTLQEAEQILNGNGITY
ncbi:MAG: zinc ribbon domain-containing protein, partial [Clostridia bacterium]|nr:zinc ribbon domain-containing protein [Clostridia bacterium]